MTDDSEHRRDTPTIEAPPLSEREPERATSPEASERPAIAPPARVPDADELATTAIASKKPPSWWADSFLAKELGAFADQARALREGRDGQHAEQMRAIDRIGIDMAELAREMGANYELLAGEFRRFRDASDARDAAQDGRIHQLERQVEELEAKLIRVMQERFAEALKPIADEMQQIRDALADLKKHGTPRPPTPAAPG
jgi:hypothetical protein